MTIELTDEEKATLRRRQALRTARATFSDHVEADALSKASKKQLRKGKAQKRAKVYATMTAYGALRSDAECRTDRYLDREKSQFYQSRLWKTARYQALKRANGRCELCGELPKEGKPLHVDHIKSRSKHPELSLVVSNLQVLCEPCNVGKGAWDETDWRKATLGDDVAPA